MREVLLCDWKASLGFVPATDKLFRATSRLRADLPEARFSTTSCLPIIQPEPTARIDSSHRIDKYWPRLPPHLAHPPQDNRTIAIHALGPSLQRSRQNCSEPCCLLLSDIPGCGLVVITTRRLCTINTSAPFDRVEVYLQNAPFAEDEFSHRYQGDLCALAEDRPARPEEQVLYKLLCNGGGTRGAFAFQILWAAIWISCQSNPWCW